MDRATCIKKLCVSSPSVQVKHILVQFTFTSQGLLAVTMTCCFILTVLLSFALSRSFLPFYQLAVQCVTPGSRCLPSLYKLGWLCQYMQRLSKCVPVIVVLCRSPCTWVPLCLPGFSELSHRLVLLHKVIYTLWFWSVSWEQLRNSTLVPAARLEPLVSNANMRNRIKGNHREASDLIHMYVCCLFQTPSAHPPPPTHIMRVSAGKDVLRW